LSAGYTQVCDELKTAEEDAAKLLVDNKRLSLDLEDEKECLSHITTELTEAKNHEAQLLQQFEADMEELKDARVADKKLYKEKRRADRDAAETEIARLQQHLEELLEVQAQYERLIEIHSQCDHNLAEVQAELEKTRQKNQIAMIEISKIQGKLMDQRKETASLHAKLDLYRSSSNGMLGAANFSPAASPSRRRVPGVQRGKEDEQQRPFKVYAVHDPQSRPLSKDKQ
jgi:chromosome segregation ATPase